MPRVQRRLRADGRGIRCAWRRRGESGEQRIAAGELRLLLPGRHSEVRGDLWMPLTLTVTL